MTTRSKIIAAYVAVAIITFGHAWNRDYSDNPDTAQKQSAALLAAPVVSALWPLYWSAFAWKNFSPK